MLRRIAATIIPPAVEDEVGPGVFPLMDSVRAMAALSIVAYHLLPRTGLGDAGGDLVRTLVIGVPIFFVVSGFLLYRPFARAARFETPSPRAAPYAWRRFLRIVPAYWFILTFLLLGGDQQVRPIDAPLLYGFAQVYDPERYHLGISQAWSLCCEVVYYAMLPLVVVALRGLGTGSRTWLRREVVMLVALFGLSFVWKLWAVGWGYTTIDIGRAFVFHPGWNLDLFVLGMALAVWSVHREAAGTDDRVGRFAARRASLLWLAGAGMFVVVALRRDRFSSNSGAIEIHMLEAVCAVLFFLPAVTGKPREGWLRRHVLANRALLALGVISYGIYLWHLTIIQLLLGDRRAGFELWLGGWTDVVLVPVALLMILAFAAGSWAFVERPALSLKRLVPSRPRRAPLPPPRQAPEGADG